MMHYSVQPSDQIFVKGYQFLSFHGNMGKNIGKNINKYLSSKYSQKLIDHAKQSVEIHWKNQLMIYRMMIYRITKISKTSPENNSVKTLNMIEKYIEKDIFLQNKDKIIDDLGSIQ